MTELVQTPIQLGSNQKRVVSTTTVINRCRLPTNMRIANAIHSCNNAIKNHYLKELSKVNNSLSESDDETIFTLKNGRQASTKRTGVFLALDIVVKRLLNHRSSINPKVAELGEERLAMICELYNYVYDFKNHNEKHAKAMALLIMDYVLYEYKKMVGDKSSSISRVIHLINKTYWNHKSLHGIIKCLRYIMQKYEYYKNKIYNLTHYKPNNALSRYKKTSQLVNNLDTSNLHPELILTKTKFNNLMEICYQIRDLSKTQDEIRAMYSYANKVKNGIYVKYNQESKMAYQKRVDRRNRKSQNMNRFTNAYNIVTNNKSDTLSNNNTMTYIKNYKYRSQFNLEDTITESINAAAKSDEENQSFELDDTESWTDDEDLEAMFNNELDDVMLSIPEIDEELLMLQEKPTINYNNMEDDIEDEYMMGEDDESDSDLYMDDSEPEDIQVVKIDDNDI